MRTLLLITAAMLLTTVVLAQQKIITGTVSGKTGGEPLQGVSVKSKNQTVITDVNGKFSIEATIGETVNLSHVGMKPSSFTVSASTQDVNLTMEEGAGSLEEVVVTGYGTQKKQVLPARFT